MPPVRPSTTQPATIWSCGIEVPSWVGWVTLQLSSRGWIPALSRSGFPPLLELGSCVEYEFTGVLSILIFLLYSYDISAYLYGCQYLYIWTQCDIASEVILSGSLDLLRTSALSLLQIATCYMLHATCYRICARCYRLCATCYRLCAICHVLHATCYMLHTQTLIYFMNTEKQFIFVLSDLMISKAGLIQYKVNHLSHKVVLFNCDIP